MAGVFWVEFMQDNLQPINVAGATIVIQLSILIIMFVGLFLFRRDPHPHAPKWREIPYALIVILAILSIMSIVMTKEFYAVWSPIMGDFQLPTINRDFGFLTVFILDIVVTSILIFLTGGVRSSPFTAILFMLPTLAIFLREPPVRFVSYSILVGLIYFFSSKFTSTVVNPTWGVEVDKELASNRWVNITCLIMSTVVGFITRPQFL